MKTKMLSLSASAVLFGGLMVGCGSDSNDNNGGGGGNPPSTQLSISGKAVDGYLRYATVCLDLSKDGYCQAGEPYAITGDDGEFEITLTDLHRNHANFATAPLVAYGGIDSDTNEDFVGKLKAPNDGKATINVTPLTTLVAEISKGDRAEIEAAQTKVATILGLGVSDVSGDPVQLAKDGKTAPLSRALEVQKSVERMIKDQLPGNKNTKASELFTTLAETLNKATIATSMSDIIESSTVDATYDKVGAKQLAILIKDVMTSTKSLNTDEIVEVAARISSAKNEPTVPTVLKNASDAMLDTVRKLGNEISIDGDEIFPLFAYGTNTGPLKINMTYEMMIEKLKNDTSSVAIKLTTFLKAKIEEKEELKAEAEDAKEQANNATKPYLSVSQPFYLYEIENHWDSSLSISEDIFANGTIAFSERKWTGTTWEIYNEDDTEYMLQKDGTWKTRSYDYIVAPDNSFLGDGFKIGIISSVDLSGQHTVEIGNSEDFTVDMTSGAKEYTIKQEFSESYYQLWKPAMNYTTEPDYTNLTTLEDLITHRCGNNGYFMEQIGFAGAYEGEEYKCDTTKKEGKLIQSKWIENIWTVVNDNVGTWEIKTVNGHDILIATPYESSDDEDNIIFTVANPDGEGDKVWYGAYDKKGVVHTWKTYNKTAIDIIKAEIKTFN